jgi:hypothetical protein
MRFACRSSRYTGESKTPTTSSISIESDKIPNTRYHYLKRSAASIPVPLGMTGVKRQLAEKKERVTEEHKSGKQETHDSDRHRFISRRP